MEEEEEAMEVEMEEEEEVGEVGGRAGQRGSRRANTPRGSSSRRPSSALPPQRCSPPERQKEKQRASFRRVRRPLMERSPAPSDGSRTAVVGSAAWEGVASPLAAPLPPLPSPAAASPSPSPPAWRRVAEGRGGAGQRRACLAMAEGGRVLAARRARRKIAASLAPLSVRRVFVRGRSVGCVAAAAAAAARAVGAVG